jgi:hypothetical protein
VPHYRVIQGEHIQDGKSYTQGAIIESDHDLVKMAKNKFERVASPEPRVRQPLPIPGGVQVDPEKVPPAPPHISPENEWPDDDDEAVDLARTGGPVDRSPKPKSKKNKA